jgi:hypothetical protein
MDSKIQKSSNTSPSAPPLPPAPPHSNLPLATAVQSNISPTSAVAVKITADDFDTLHLYYSDHPVTNKFFTHIVDGNCKEVEDMLKEIGVTRGIQSTFSTYSDRAEKFFLLLHSINKKVTKYVTLKDRDAYGFTALQMACFYSRYDCVATILNYLIGVDPVFTRKYINTMVLNGKYRNFRAIDLIGMSQKYNDLSSSAASVAKGALSMSKQVVRTLGRTVRDAATLNVGSLVGNVGKTGVSALSTGVNKGSNAARVVGKKVSNAARATKKRLADAGSYVWNMGRSRPTDVTDNSVGGNNTVDQQDIGLSKQSPAQHVDESAGNTIKTLLMTFGSLPPTYTNEQLKDYYLCGTLVKKKFVLSKDAKMFYKPLTQRDALTGENTVRYILMVGNGDLTILDTDTSQLFTCIEVEDYTVNTIDAPSTFMANYEGGKSRRKSRKYINERSYRRSTQRMRSKK